MQGEQLRRMRRIGMVVIAAGLAVGAGGTLLAQSPPPTPTPGATPPPARTSTLFGPNGTPRPVQPALSTPQGSPVPSASPASSPAASSSPVPSGAPSPSGSPAPSASPVGLPPPPPLVSEGVTLLGVFASDIDNMITPADEFQIVALVRAPGVTRLTMRMSGAPFLTASQTFDIAPGDNWLQIANFRVDTELEPVIREEVIRKLNSSIAIRAGALVIAMDVTDASGTRTARFEPEVRDFNKPGTVAKVEYPDLKRITGLPTPTTGDGSYYLRGNDDFHHPDDFYVRKLAVEAGRNGGVFPDDPSLVADNIFNYINALLGDRDPGDFNNDYNIARLIDEGTIKRGQINGGYICIGQTYFMSSLTRTLGIPSRELNLAIGRPSWKGNDGVWRVTWWQEGAVQVWVNGEWSHYDLWLGFKGLDNYFTANLAYQAWATYEKRATMFTTVGGVNTGLRGHDFNLFPGDPPHFEFVGEAVKPGVLVQGMPDENGNPITQGERLSAYRAPGAPAAPAGETASPPAKGITTAPETRP